MTLSQTLHSDSLNPPSLANSTSTTPNPAGRAAQHQSVCRALATPPPPLRDRAARHRRDARLLARRLRVLRVGPDGLGRAGGRRLDRLRVVVGRGAPGALAHRGAHVEDAALALQVAALELEDVDLERGRLRLRGAWRRPGAERGWAEATDQ